MHMYTNASTNMKTWTHVCTHNMRPLSGHLDYSRRPVDTDVTCPVWVTEVEEQDYCHSQWVGECHSVVMPLPT